MRAPLRMKGALPMKIVSISQDFFDLVEGDRELMLKHNRPCIVVVRLRFRGKRRDFACFLSIRSDQKYHQELNIPMICFCTSRSRDMASLRT